MLLQKPIRLLSAAALSSTMLTVSAERVDAAGYIFAGETYGLNIVTHGMGYNGTGGNLTVTVGIDPTSMFAAQMAISVQNVVNTWNGLQATTNNFQQGLIASNQFDFESVMLHEMGHSLGLSHPNLASESFLNGADRNYTKSTKGANNVFDINAGADGVIGSRDDIRGDDVNLNYFRIADNDPFATNLGVVDSTTYSRDIADLPVGDSFAVNADRDVANLMGYGNTESVMQQGTFAGETQRTLAADDVAGILYARSGIDEIAGTLDDYSITLDFVGNMLGADIMIDFDNNQTGFAVSQSSGSFIAQDHVAITQSSIFFNTGFNWFFNDQPNDIMVQPVPLMSSGWALIAGMAGLGGMSLRRRQRAQSV